MIDSRCRSSDWESPRDGLVVLAMSKPTSKDAMTLSYFTIISSLISSVLLLACDEKKLPLGSTCSESWECESGLCESNVCIDPVNARCDDGLTRVDGLCIELETCANSNPCGARGTCIEAETGLACSCDDGWTGATCDACASGQALCGEACCAADELCVANACVGDACAARGGDVDGDGVCADTDPCPEDKVDACASVASEPLLVYERFLSANNTLDATYGPDFETFMEGQRERAIAIGYHTPWPGSGEVMNVYNTADVDVRVAYYEVPGIPHLQLGRAFTGHIMQVNAELVGTHFAETPAEFDFDLNAVIDARVLRITGGVVASSPQAETDYVLHIVVTEDPIDFETAPGFNGLTRFRDVMRKMIPDAQGIPLGDGGTRVTVDESWNIVAPADPDRLSVLVFAQAVTSGKVHKGVRITPGRVVPTPR